MLPPESMVTSGLELLIPYPDPWPCHSWDFCCSSCLCYHKAHVKHLLKHELKYKGLSELIPQLSSPGRTLTRSRELAPSLT